MRWLLRLLVLRVLGMRAVTFFALLGLIRTLRAARARDLDRAEPRTAANALRSSSRVR